jgi:hypothetical protein
MFNYIESGMSIDFHTPIISRPVGPSALPIHPSSRQNPSNDSKPRKGINIRIRSHESYSNKATIVMSSILFLLPGFRKDDSMEPIQFVKFLDRNVNHDDATEDFKYHGSRKHCRLIHQLLSLKQEGSKASLRRRILLLLASAPNDEDFDAWIWTLT